MTKANWKEAPEGAETWEKCDIEMTSPKFCKPGYWWHGYANKWIEKKNEVWTILERRPRIIEWEDMKEGMVVRVSKFYGKGIRFYEYGVDYPVKTVEEVTGPYCKDYGITLYPEHYTFELVREPEQRKTVKDAVKYYNGVWPDCGKDEIWHCDILGHGVSHDYKVCNREEFEAEVKRQEGESAIVFGFGANVPLSFVAQDGTKYELNDYSGDRAEYYKVKPTITKAQAWDIAKRDAVLPSSVEEDYEVE